MILDVDIGNSRIKWRIKALGQGGVVDLSDLEAVFETARQWSVQDVRVSCVAGPSVAKKAALLCRRHQGVSPWFAKVQSRCAGLTIAYREPDLLGVDRWLAMLAAYHRCNGPCAVVDAGSAVTADFIGSGGRHLGGMIVPGPRLMARALFADTANVKVGALTLPQNWGPGCDTVSGVANGVKAAMVGLSEQIGGYVECELGMSVPIYLCGCGADALAGGNPRFSPAPDLVLDGLAVAAS